MTEQTKAPAKAQAAEPAQAPAAPAEGNVIVRILPQGDDKVFTGKEVNGQQTRYAKGDRAELLEAVAKALEDRGFVEIL